MLASPAFVSFRRSFAVRPRARVSAPFVSPWRALREKRILKNPHSRVPFSPRCMSSCPRCCRFCCPPLFLWCLVTYMSSRRRRFPDAANTSSRRRPSNRRFYYERWPAARLAGCTDTRVRPITGPSNPPATRRVTCSSPVLPYPWPWSCPCRSRAAAANPRNHRASIKCLPTTRRRRTRDEGKLSPVAYYRYRRRRRMSESRPRRQNRCLKITLFE